MPPRYTPRGRDDPYGDVPQAMDFAREGVEGYGETLRPGLLHDIGTTLGGLNEIGALRSGTVGTELHSIGERYGAQVGAYGKMAASESVRTGLEANRLRFEREEARRKRKSGVVKAIGSVLGAAVGFVASGGNPLGAAAGYSAGGGVGASDASYDGAYG